MTKAVQAMEVAPSVVDSIVIVGVLTHCALLHSVCDLEAALVNYNVV